MMSHELGFIIILCIIMYSLMLSQQLATRKWPGGAGLEIRFFFFFGSSLPFFMLNSVTVTGDPAAVPGHHLNYLISLPYFTCFAICTVCEYFDTKISKACIRLVYSLVSQTCMWTSGHETERYNYACVHVWLTWVSFPGHQLQCTGLGTRSTMLGNQTH